MDTQLQNSSEEDVIKRYLYDGYSYCEILCFLAKYHNISISLRQLHRILRKYGLFRRKNYSSLNQIILALKMLVKEFSSSLGYWGIHQKLRQLGCFIDKETVRLCLKILDPSGAELWICRRLQRRAYLSPGPDHTWHIDGYDKLKPYVFAIHRAIDGYSRRILWLYVSASSNNPSDIAFYSFKLLQSWMGFLKLYVETEAQKMLLYVVCSNFWDEISMTHSLVKLTFGMVLQRPINE